MATIADLNVRLSMNIRDFQKARYKAMRDIKAMGREFQDIGNTLTFSVTAPLLALGGSAIRASGQLEVMEKSLTSMMGSTTAAKKEMEALRTVARDPGLNFEQAVKGSVRLQAVGLEAETARRALSAFGNAITLAGGTSADLDGVTLALTQIISKGKVSAEEINQLAERVPQVRAAMKDLFGTADTEEIQKLGIEAEDFVTQLIGQFEKLPKAQGGLLNSIENIGQSATLFLAKLGDEINTSFNLQEVFEGIGETLETLADRFSALSPETKRTILEFGGLALAAGPLVKVLGFMITNLQAARLQVLTMVKAFKEASSAGTGFWGTLNKLGGMNPAALFSGIALALGAAVIAYRHFNREVNETTKASVEAKKSIVGERLEAEKLVNVLRDKNAKRKDQVNALNRLKEINKDYFGGLSLEKSSITEINGALNGYIANLLRVAKIKAAEAKIIELEQKKIDLQNKENGLLDDAINFIRAAGAGMSVAAYESKILNEELSKIDTQIESLAKMAEANGGGLMPDLVAGGSGGGGSSGGGGGSSPIKQRAQDMRELLTAEQAYFAYGQEARSQMVESMTAVGITHDMLKEKLVEAIEPIQQAWIDLSAIMEDAALAAGEAMLAMAQQGELSFKKLGKAALKGAADVVRAALMKAVAQQIEKLLQMVPPPFNIAIAAAGGAAVGVMFNKVLSGLKIPALAEGGIAMAPTLAMVGDNPGRGEAIIPLEKFSQVFGSAGGGDVDVKILATPQGLLAMIEKAEKDRSRRSGF